MELNASQGTIPTGDKESPQMKLNEGQLKAFKAIQEGRNIFLTGQAGTGKSELIKRVKELYEQRGMICSVTSLTGVSALAIRGTTIHRWAGIGLGDLSCVDLLEKVRKKRYAAKHWKTTNLLVIDEVSMMSPDLLEKLDFV